MTTGTNTAVEGIGDALGNSRLYQGPSIQQADIAYGFLCSDKVDVLAAEQGDSELLDLLPDDGEWPGFDADRVVIPLPLSEFLAYKSALAYLNEAELEATLRDSCQGISCFKFFDSAKSKISDTQGYGFLYQNRAYIVMRGTSSATDWRGNLNDRQTSAVDDEELKTLGITREQLEPGGKETPARHLGFCIGWAAVREQIESWIHEALPMKDKHTFIFSGHSLGGALAFIGAHEFSDVRERTVGAVITFGAPIAGSGKFAKAYDKLLGPRTVRFEAKGDSVPRIMQRRYYRLYLRLRQAGQKLRFKQSGQNLTDKSNEFDPPAPVGFCLSFAEQPPLARKDMDYAIEQAFMEYQNRLEEERRASEEAEEDQDQSTEETSGESDETQDIEPEDSGSDASETEPSVEVEAEQGVDSVNAEQADGASKTSGADDKLPVLFIGLILTAVIGIGGWIFAKRKLASHNIQQRYALYLSTLSYQRLRELRAGNLDNANRDLRLYKKFIRGDFENARSHPLKSVGEVPFELSIDDKIDFYFSARKENIV